MDESKEKVKEETKKEEPKKMEKEKTVQEVFDELTEEQKTVVYKMVPEGGV